MNAAPRTDRPPAWPAATSRPGPATLPPRLQPPWRNAVSALATTATRRSLFHRLQGCPSAKCMDANSKASRAAAVERSSDRARRGPAAGSRQVVSEDPDELPLVLSEGVRRVELRRPVASHLDAGRLGLQQGELLQTGPSPAPAGGHERMFSTVRFGTARPAWRSRLSTALPLSLHELSRTAGCAKRGLVLSEADALPIGRRPLAATTELCSVRSPVLCRFSLLRPACGGASRQHPPRPTRPMLAPWALAHCC